MSQISALGNESHDKFWENVKGNLWNYTVVVTLLDLQLLKNIYTKRFNMKYNKIKGQYSCCHFQCFCPIVIVDSID